MVWLEGLSLLGGGSWRIFILEWGGGRVWKLNRLFMMVVF